jgi:hypothetical protein
MYRRVVKLKLTDAMIIGLMMEALRTSETSVDNYFTWQYIPEDNSEQLHSLFRISKSTYLISVSISDYSSYELHVGI